MTRHAIIEQDRSHVLRERWCGVGYLPGGSQYKDAAAFVILIAILLVKPSGLLGKNVVEKV